MQKVYRALGITFLFLLAVCGTALAQGTQVSGTVTSATTGEKLWGVTVRVKGTQTQTVTDQQGRYALVAPSDAVLTFAMIGFRGKDQPVSGQASIDVGLEQAPTMLQEVVVTGYEAQRRADITGAVSSVNLESANKQTGTSVLQRLDGRVPGLTINSSGSPGSRSTVRIRGVSSFHDNDPLYIIDGTPVQDSYLNFLNPNDVAEVQVLKDASSASIYGSRASNGVVIIETKKGRPGGRTAALEVRTGVATPIRGYDDLVMTDALEYFHVISAAYHNAGQALPPEVKALYGDTLNPSVPKYTYIAPGVTVVTRDAFGRPDQIDLTAYSYPNALIMPGSAGTNWWKAVFGTGSVTDANLSVSGGGLDDNALGEGNIVGKNILMQPVVPIYDVGGNFASGKATGLGNNTNPLKYAWARRFDRNTNDRGIGNVFGRFAVMPTLSIRSQFSFNLFQSQFTGFTPTTFENSEANAVNSIAQNDNRTTSWTITNTLNYGKVFNRHSVAVLIGQEANSSNGRFMAGGISGLLNDAPQSRYIDDALGSAASKTVNSTGFFDRLLSYFGKADYNYAEKYYASVTVRRDGSSKFAVDNRWGTFPAFNVGWRLTRESFFPQDGFFSNVMLRVGYGVTGNQQIPGGRIVAKFGGGTGDTFYDINGSGTSIVAGFRQIALGNANLKWETNRSVNSGADLEFLHGRGTFTFDIYSRTTDDLLFDPRTPSTAGAASPAIQNVGKMSNKGFDFAASYSGTMAGGKVWSVAFNGSHYKNKILRIDGQINSFVGPGGPQITRIGNPIINQVGQPMGSFYGLIANGYFLTAADAAAHRTNTSGTCTTAPCQDGAEVGRIKFVDVDGNGRITSADRTIIGSPHPDFRRAERLLRVPRLLDERHEGPAHELVLHHR